jgi:hypothetical protein
MQRPLKRPEDRLEANLRKAYRAPPEGSEPHDLRKLLSRLKDAFDARQSERRAKDGGTCH